MGCIVEFNEPRVQFEFCSNRHKQKILIDALLHYGRLNISSLATVLDLPLNTLCAVHNGTSFFEGEQADNLARLFLINFGD